MGKRVLSMDLLMKFRLLRFLRAPLIAYVTVCLLVGVFQRLLIYHPVHRTEAAMLLEATDLRCEPWRDAGGTVIGWRRAKSADQPKAPNRMLVFDGNTGYALHRNYYARGFERLVDGRQWEVTLFEYPGYGARAGDINEKSFVEAGASALAALKAEDTRPVYVLGESLGSGLACALAQKSPGQVAGVFLVTPYARMGDVAANRFWFLPVRMMLRDPWDNVTALNDFRGPVAMLIAGEDEVVTAPQGRMLYQSFGGVKRLWTDPDARHNTVDFSAGARWWQEVSDFLLEGASRNVAR